MQRLHRETVSLRGRNRDNSAYETVFVQTVNSMCDENGNEIEVANHAEQIVKFKTAQPVCEGAMLRKKK